MEGDALYPKKCKHSDSQLDLSFFMNGIIWRLCSICGKRWRVKFADNDSVTINEFSDDQHHF